MDVPSFLPATEQIFSTGTQIPVEIAPSSSIIEIHQGLTERRLESSMEAKEQAQTWADGAEGWRPISLAAAQLLSCSLSGLLRAEGPAHGGCCLLRPGVVFYI